MGEPISKAQNGNKRDDGLTATGLRPSHPPRTRMFALQYSLEFRSFRDRIKKLRQHPTMALTYSSVPNYRNRAAI